MGALLLEKDTSSILKSTWSLAWPVVLEQALAMIAQVVDMAMVGKLGKEAVAAIGLSMQPFFLVNALVMGLSTGTTALCARAVGAGREDEASKIAGESVIIALLFGLFVSTAGYLNSSWVIKFMRAEPPVMALGSQYVKAMMPGMVFFFVSMIASGALRAAGDTRTPMIINLVVNIFHVFTNWVFIFGEMGFPSMGVVGAGLSTSLSRALGAVALLALMFRGNLSLKLKSSDVVGRFEWDLFKRVLNVGVPAALERVLTSSGQIAYSREVAALGTTLYAAHTISLNVESFSYMPGMGFSTAATSLVGQKLGAGDPKTAEKSAVLSTYMAVLTMGICGLMFFCFPRGFLRIFTSDESVIRAGVPLLRIVAFTQIPEAVGFVVPGALRGAGDTKIAMYVTVLGIWVVRLGLTKILMGMLQMGLNGAWIAMFMDWVVRASLYSWRLKTGKWKTLRV